MKNYFKNIGEILKFHDIQPLLLFWCFSDVLNNQVLWTNYEYWVNLEQPNTYYLYMTYLFVSVGMLVFLNNLKWLSRFITIYLILTLYATIRFVIDIITSEDLEFENSVIRALTITFFYFIMWGWIWFKVKREILFKKIQNG